MSSLVRFTAEDGAGLLVEVDENAYGMERVGIVGDAVADAGRRLEEAFETVRPALRRLSQMLREFAPEEHEVEFGLKLNVEAGAIVARTATEGHFVVKLRWARDTP